MMSTSTIRTSTAIIEQQSTLAQISWISGFAALTAVGAQIEVPHSPVPFTLQTFFVLLAGAMLGKRNGAFSQLAYLAIGIAGLPVFSSGGFGLAKILGPTGGYLLSFPVAAFVVGYLLNASRNLIWVVASMIAGMLIIFSLGTLQLYFVYFQDWKLAFANGFLIFSWWDVVKIAAAASIYHRLAPRVRPTTS